MKKKNTTDFRLEIIEYAEKHNIVEAAKLFEVSRKSISRWLKKYKISGISGLEDIGKKKLYKNKLNNEVISSIFDLKQKEPKITLNSIKKRLNLQCSISSISNTIKKSTTNDKKNDISDFVENKWQTYISNFGTIYCKGNKRNLFQLVFEEIGTGLKFLSYSFEKSNINVLIFVDYIINNLQNKGYDLKNMTIFYPKTTIYTNLRNSSKKSSFEKLLDDKYNIKNRKTLKIVKNFYEKEILSDKNKIDILVLSLLYLISDGFENNKYNTYNKIIIPPIFTDDYISDINLIKNQSEYWKNLSVIKNIEIENALEIFHKKGDESAGNYEFKNALEFYDTILESIKVRSDKSEIIVELFYKKGHIYHLIGDYEKGFDFLKKALEIAIKENLIKRCVEIELYIGNMYNEKSDMKNAEFFYEDSLSKYKESFGETTKTYIYYEIKTNLASCRYDLKETLVSSKKMLKEARKENNNLNIITSLYYLSQLYIAQKKSDIALKLSLEAYNLALKMGDKFQIAKGNLFVGNIYEILGDFVLATKYYKLLINLAPDISDTRIIAMGYYKSGKIYFMNKEYDKALSKYLNSLYIFKKIGYQKMFPIVYKDIALTHKKIGNYKKSIGFLKEALELAKKMNDANLQSDILSCFAELYFKLKKYNFAIKYYKKQRRILDKTDPSKKSEIDKKIHEIKNMLQEI